MLFKLYPLPLVLIHVYPLSSLAPYSPVTKCYIRRARGSRFKNTGKANRQLQCDGPKLLPLMNIEDHQPCFAHQYRLFTHR